MGVLAAGLDATRLEAPGLRLRQPLSERWRLEVEERSLGASVLYAGTLWAVQARLPRIIESPLLMQALQQAHGAGHLRRGRWASLDRCAT